MSAMYKILRDAILNDPMPYTERQRPRWQQRLAWLVRKWREPIREYPDTVRVVLVDDPPATDY